MKCSKCSFYKSCFHCEEPWNTCELTGFDNFKEQNSCPFVNDDGSINQEELEKSENKD